MIGGDVEGRRMGRECQAGRRTKYTNNWQAIIPGWGPYGKVVNANRDLQVRNEQVGQKFPTMK